MFFCGHLWFHTLLLPIKNGFIQKLFNMIQKKKIKRLQENSNIKRKTEDITASVQFSGQATTKKSTVNLPPPPHISILNQYKGTPSMPVLEMTDNLFYQIKLKTVLEAACAHELPQWFVCVVWVPHILLILYSSTPHASVSSQDELWLVSKSWDGSTMIILNYEQCIYAQVRIWCRTGWEHEAPQQYKEI